MFNWQNYTIGDKITILGIVVAIIFTIAGWFLAPVVEDWVKNKNNRDDNVVLRPITTNSIKEYTLDKIVESKFNLFLKTGDETVLDSLTTKLMGNCSVIICHNDRTTSPKQTYSMYFDYLKANRKDIDSIQVKLANSNELNKVTEISTIHYKF